MPALQKVDFDPGFPKDARIRMRWLFLFITFISFHDAAAQSLPKLSYDITEAQYKIVQQCGTAASTAAEAFRRFPKDEKKRMAFVNEVDKNLPRNQPENTIDWPTPLQIVATLMSMEIDLPLSANLPNKSMNNDFLIARASARCALYSANTASND